MKEDVIAKLTAKDDKYACSFADRILSESRETDKWYEYFDDFASLLHHPKSLVRNRCIFLRQMLSGTGRIVLTPSCPIFSHT